MPPTLTVSASAANENFIPKAVRSLTSSAIFDAEMHDVTLSIRVAPIKGTT